MADNRKYYYLKLKESYFDDDAIVLLESMPDGILYSNILTDDRHSYPSAGRPGGTGVRDFSAVGACGAATRRLALHDRY